MKRIVSTLVCMWLINFSYGQAYKGPLDKLNNYLKTFDNGYYGYFEIIDGYLYDRFQSGKYSKVNMYDLTEATEEEANQRVIVKCKTDAKCVYSTYTDSYHEKLQFSTSTNFNTSELISLLNKLIAAYTNNSNLLNKNKSTLIDRDKLANERRSATGQ